MTPCNLEEFFVFPWKLKLLVNSFCKFRCRTSKVFIPLINLLKFDNFTVCLDCSHGAGTYLTPSPQAFRLSLGALIPGKGYGAGVLLLCGREDFFFSSLFHLSPPLFFSPFFLSFPPFVSFICHLSVVC